MNKQSKSITAISLLFFFAGGAAWFIFALLLTDYAHLAVPVAAASAAIGGFIMVINAFLRPESVQRPIIQPPQINIPHGVGNNYGHKTIYTEASHKVPGIINVDEWPIVRLFKKDSAPLTRRQQMRGTICCLLWIATVLIYLPISFHMDNFEISWVIFLGTAVIHSLIYWMLSIGERKEIKS